MPGMPPAAPSFLDILDGEDEWTELVDAQIDRIDLVKSPANGKPFVLAKSAADGGNGGLVPPTHIRSLITKKEDPMTASGGKRTYKIVKAGGKLQVAVYDESGKLLGTVDPDKITELQSSDKNDQATVDANAARVQAQHDPNAQAADELTKSLHDAFRGLKPRPVNLRKASIGTVTEGWSELMKALDPNREKAVKVIVSSSAMKFMAGGAPPATSVGVSKRAAVLLARQQGLI